MNRWAKLLRLAGVLLAAGSVALAAAPVAWHWSGGNDILPPPAAPARAPAPPAPAPVDTLAILALAPFGSPPPPEAPAAPVQQTTLQLELRGVVQARDPAKSLAVIASPDVTRGYLPGDDVDGQALLVSVAANHVILDIDGRQEILAFPDAEIDLATPEETAPAPDDPLDRLAGRIVTSPRAREEPPETTEEYIDFWRKRIQRNPAGVLKSIGLIPTDDGYIIANEHDSGVRLAGLRPGDLVARVNGEQVGDVNSDKALYDRIAASGLARLEVVRDGKTLTLSFPLR
ncbi:type II secretion system protein N [Oceaniglobus trochenteri]|uniref:type II secretion system protein N n=1 Tax=Oceaniglobus trochenteri TaxID=2763260 RepID=UPI001CFFA684|nr:type II secretion system protein N [Oceaniglobus trochenteri]